MNRLVLFLKKHLIYLPFIFLLLLIIFFLFAINATDKSREQETTLLPTQPIQNSSPTPLLQKAFSIQSTFPKHGDTVLPGKINLSIVTDVPILNSEIISINVYPKPIGGIRFENIFPTKTIRATFTAEQQKNTVYDIVIRGNKKELLYAWTINVSPTIPAQQNAVDIDEEFHSNTYDPLFNDIPYTSINFDVDYTDIYTLTVTVKNSDRQLVKQQLHAWITSHGIDPSQYDIDYIDKF